MEFNVVRRILPYSSLKKYLLNLVDSREQDHYSRRAYFSRQNYINLTGCLKTMIFIHQLLYCIK